MGEIIQAIIYLVLCVGALVAIVWFLILALRSSAAHAQNLLTRVAALDGNGTPTSLDKLAVFAPMLGGAGRRKSTVYVGQNYLLLYAPQPGQSDFLQIAWSDVLDVALREPDLPQIMNVNAAAVLANAATRAQYGMDVVVTIYENGRADDLIFGGLLGRAMEMANLIRQRIHTVPVAAV